MTMRRRLFSIAAAMLLLFPGSGRCDDVKDRIRRAEAEIARINRLVGDTRKEQGATLDNLKLIGTKLENRQSIVQGIETEMGTLERENAAARRTAKTVRSPKRQIFSTYSDRIQELSP